MNILILGGAGQVGTALQAPALWDAGTRLHAPSRTALDVTDAAAIAAALGARPYAAVVNAAAYTAVDRAESEIAAAWSLNAVAPALLAAATARAGIPLVHVSTDYVFDGRTEAPCTPDRPVNPQSVYGASKAAGEIAVRSANPRHAIIRTAWVVSPHRGCHHPHRLGGEPAPGLAGGSQGAARRQRADTGSSDDARLTRPASKAEYLENG
ncbi:sugar nucleotide-binding protein [Methylobacterium sp. Leaf104]|uniref:sugar nucleotide-binding protein n=1 Tax=Methylobacterium sp. Leaf104 TaxID=1736254 RepID=UPI0009E85D27|nr:sugar nucleotide-binding protein [Methylobacterium sp. Leaf104]